MTIEQIKFLGKLLAALRVARSYIAYGGTDAAKQEALRLIDEVINRKENKENNELH